MDTPLTPPEQLPYGKSPQDARIAEMEREGWRELGFWYDCDVSEKRWLFRADRKGIAAFAAEVRRFAAAAEVGEHTHLGPFSNLRLICAEKRGVTWRGIAGRKEDFEELAAELERRAQTGAKGRQDLGEGGAGVDSYRLVLVVEEDGFDPGAADQSGLSQGRSN